MPKIVCLFLLGLFLLIPDPSAKAAPGDTTWVTVYNLRKLDHHGNFDTTAVYPSLKRYRKIRMHYILGVYNCPNNPQYCADWDYTTQVFARPKDMDTLEIAKVITPYAGDWLGKNISHDYVVDVTDYASALHDTVGMRFRYDGYSWGFTITLKLEFIEGIPPMDVVSVENIYDGYFPYGHAGNSIENYLTAKTFSYSSGASVSRVFVKNSVSGHGADATGCAEFCSKFYNLKVNNAQIAQRQLWRNDCGRNPVSPQPGTWIYDRGNWCPGDVVRPLFHDISGYVVADTPFDIDIDMQAYTSNTTTPGYNVVSQLFTYGPENHTTDISIEEILAPRKDQHFFSNNSACMNPVIRIKNSGYDSVHTIVFEYGLRGFMPTTYTWTGSIGFLQESTIYFPPSVELMSQPSSHNFDVRVKSVNDIQGDDYDANNFYSSKTNTLLTLPREFVIRTKTNGSNKPASNINQTRWLLTNDNGDTIASRLSMASNTFFRDSLYTLADGCYKLTIDDSGCDGFSWWANPGAGHGTISINLPSFDTKLHTFNGDFGCSSTTYFYIGNRPTPPPPVTDYTGLPEHAEQIPVLIFPNPANNNLTVRVGSAFHGKMEILDVTGRMIQSTVIEFRRGGDQQLSTNGFANGMYFLKLSSEGQNVTVKKFMVQH